MIYKPEFSVVIPLYNKENYILDTVYSALNQTDVAIEVIIINDGSTDNSVERVEQINDSRVTLYHEKNKGVSSARNLGIKKARAEYVAFLDADDIWRPDHLIKIRKLISKFPSKGLYSSSYSKFVNKSDIDKLISKAGCNDLDVSYTELDIVRFATLTINSKIPTWTSATVISKNLIPTCDLFELNYNHGEDIAVWLFLIHNYGGAIQSIETAYYRVGDPSSLTNKSIVESDATILFINDTLKNSTLRLDEIKAFKSIHDRFSLSHAITALMKENKIISRRFLNSTFVKSKKWYLVYLLLLVPNPILLKFFRMRSGKK